MECVYCKKTLSTNSSLSYHQKTVKSCLKIQNEQGVNQSSLFNCSYCNKNITTKQNLDYHIGICKKRKEQVKIETQNNIESHLRTQKEELEYELTLKDNKIKELEERLKKTEEKINLVPVNKTHNKTQNKTVNDHSTNNNTNITNNYTIYEVMTPERVEEYFKKHYNMDTLLGGQKALARLVADGFIIEKDTYHCADRSRQKFTLVDSEGKSVEDPDCRRVIQLTASGMPHIKDVYQDSLFSTEATDERVENDLHHNYHSISKLDQEHAQFKNELSKVVPSRETEPTPTQPAESIFESMRRESAILRAEFEERKRLRRLKEANENDNANANVNVESNESESLPRMIGGMSLGALDTFRQGYRMRKKMAEENKTPLNEVEIKYPSELLSQFETNPALKNEFIAFVKS
jgi:hypothetical protein